MYIQIKLCGCLYFFLFIGFCLYWVFIAMCRFFLVVAHGLLITVASLMEHRFWSLCLVVVAHRLSCSSACGIFLDQGLNPCPLHW